MTSTKQNYSARKREAMDAVFGLKKLRNYLLFKQPFIYFANSGHLRRPLLRKAYMGGLRDGQIFLPNTISSSSIGKVS